MSSDIRTRLELQSYNTLKLARRVLKNWDEATDKERAALTKAIDEVLKDNPKTNQEYYCRNLISQIAKSLPIWSEQNKRVKTMILDYIEYGIKRLEGRADDDPTPMNTN